MTSIMTELTKKITELEDYEADLASEQLWIKTEMAAELHAIIDEFENKIDAINFDDTNSHIRIQTMKEQRDNKLTETNLAFINQLLGVVTMRMNILYQLRDTVLERDEEKVKEADRKKGNIEIQEQLLTPVEQSACVKKFDDLASYHIKVHHHIDLVDNEKYKMEKQAIIDKYDKKISSAFARKKLGLIAKYSYKLDQLEAMRDREFKNVRKRAVAVEEKLAKTATLIRQLKSENEGDDELEKENDWYEWKSN